MTGGARAALAAAVLGATLCTASVVGTATKGFQNDEEITTVTSSLSSAEKDQASADAALAATETDLTAVAAEYETRKAVLAERSGFVAAVAAADAAFTSASGKVTVEEQRAAVIAAQNTVLAEASDPAAVTAQTATVADIAAKVTAEVAAYDQRAAEAAARTSNAARSTGPSRAASPSAPVGGGDWLADMRQRLNAVGGSHISLDVYDGWCGSVRAPACAYQGVGIKVSPDIANMTPARRNWAMVHELAHFSHFARWFDINNSAGYQQLFASNPEVLANCMASARGYSNHGHHCSTEMVNWAAGIWNGTIAW